MANRPRRSIAPRLLPTTMFMALMLLGIKVGDIIRGSHDLSEMLIAARVQAQDEEGAKPKEGEKTAEGAKEGKGDAKPTAEAGAENDHKTAEKKDEKAADGKKTDTVEKEEKPKPGTERHFSQAEIDVLQNLSKRREELEKWERDIGIKEKMLTATEKRIDEKIAQVEALKAEVSNILAQYNEQEDAKIRSLVKIYENMKPKEAGRIFEEVDMPILLQVVDRMSEKKVAPILASMDPMKAKQITVELAEQRKVHQEKVRVVGLPQAGAQPPMQQPAPPAVAPKSAVPVPAQP